MNPNYVCTVMDIDAVNWPYINVYHFQPPQLSIGVEYQKTPIRLRSEPHHTYVGTDSQIYTLSMVIASSVEVGDERSAANVANDVNFLKSLEYPDYGEGDEDFIKPPHRVRIRMARIFDEFGYIHGFNATYRDAFTELGDPLFVDVNFSFEAMHNQPLSYRNVRGDKYDRSGWST